MRVLFTDAETESLQLTRVLNAGYEENLFDFVDDVPDTFDKAMPGLVMQLDTNGDDMLCIPFMTKEDCDAVTIQLFSSDKANLAEYTVLAYPDFDELFTYYEEHEEAL